MTSESRPAWKLEEPEWRTLISRVRAGRRLKPATWPGGARAAVALSFDCDHEAFELGAGGQSVGRLAWGEFGRRVGVPRILDCLSRYAVTASFFMPAAVALMDPDEPKRIRDHGHEIGMHGWIHENNSHLTYDEERGLMLRAFETLETATGMPPVGFRSANWDIGPGTMRIVRDIGLAYDSSMMADECCYEILIDGEPSGVVEIPVEWLRDDAVYLMFNRAPATRPYATPDDVFGIFRREFDAAFDEGGLFQLVMHPFVIGYRSRIWILEELIRHARQRGEVWFASHAEIAEYVKQHG